MVLTRTRESRNTQVVDTCIVFRSWHVSSTAAFLVSCAVIMGLGVLYEALRVFQKNLDARIARELVASAPGAISLSVAADETADAGKTGTGWVISNSSAFVCAFADCSSRTPVPFVPRLLRSVLYGASVFLSFFLMLIFMTYNVSSPTCAMGLPY